MATKTITFKGGQLIDTTDNIVGWVADDSSGLKFVADPATGDAQTAYSSLTHMATETSNPLWNQVSINQSSRNTTASGLFDGHITLQGIKPDGTINDIMEKRFNTTVNTGVDELHTFDLLGSNCTNDLYQQIPVDTTAGHLKVNLPLRFGKYEDVDIVGAWFDEAWQYRIAISLERTNFQLHGAEGHYSDYYGYTVYVPYSANMASTTQDDVRFCAPDGVTELPFYQLNVVDSSYAVYIVMVQWGFLDKEVESYPYNVTGPMIKNPQYVHCYYGNAAATSASDSSLGGYALFYDDFTDQDRSDALWTLKAGDADQRSVIENGYLECRSDASVDSEAYANAPLDFSGSGKTSWEVIFKIIYDTPAYNNTTVSNGPYIRLAGIDNTGTGGSDESQSYWELKHFYIAAGAGESGTNVAGHMWGRGYRDSGGAVSTAYANNINVASVSTTQYVKFRWNKRDATGGGSNYMQFYHSDDGVNWNSIGDVQGITSVFDTVTDLQAWVYYVGKAGVAADKYIRIDAVMAYPIMSGTTQHIRWEESFQNGTYLDRYAALNVAAGRTITETQDNIELRNVSGTYSRWDNTYKESLCLYLGGGLTTLTMNQQDVLVYECTVSSFAENAAAGVVTDIGLAMSDRAAIASADCSLFSLRWTATGATRTFYRQIFTAGTSVSANTLSGTWAQTDFPIGLRMMFHAKDKILYYQYRKYGSGGEWTTCGTSPAGFSAFVTGVYIIPMLFLKGATSNTQYGTFSNWRWDNGGGIIDSNGKSGTVGTGISTWFAEEDYVNDYPLAFDGGVTPSSDDMTIYYDIPSPMKRGNPMKLRTKDFGGDYNYSKTFYLTDRDGISIGPAGTDQYMGLKLVFDFNMAAEDEIEFDKVEFIYEVI